MCSLAEGRSSLEVGGDIDTMPRRRDSIRHIQIFRRHASQPIREISD